jgi:hypothetical protein
MRAEDVVGTDYWTDILRLVQVFWASGIPDRLDELKREFHSDLYRTHLETRRHMRQRIQLNNSGDIKK